MSPVEHWQWLNQFVTILESQAVNIEHFDGKMLAQLRLAERTLNFEIDQFSGSMERIEDKDGWNDLIRRRDALAEKLSSMIESDVKLGERYQQYCEGLKNHRSISAML